MVFAMSPPYMAMTLAGMLLVTLSYSSAALRVSNGFARMHHGYLNAYVVYGLSALVIALVIARFS